MGARNQRRRAGGGPARRLFARMTGRLAVAIVSGALPVGALVPNAPGPGGAGAASRTAYREAMRFLAGKGLVEARPRAGTRVAPRAAWHLLDPDVLRWSLAAQPDEAFVRDLFELRMLIEPGCARLAALRRDERQLAEIRAALDGMERTGPDTEENIRHDLAFHEAIFRAAGNAAVAALVGVVSTTLHWSLRVLGARTAAVFRQPLADHRRVFEAIERRDGDGAATLTRVLVADALRLTLASFRRLAAGRTPAAAARPAAANK
jgi:DNA-binding FadR family transcriptional regulator